MLRFICVLLMLLPSTGLANEDIEQFYTRQNCAKLEIFLETVEYYQELPLFYGMGITQTADGTPVEGVVMFYVNQDTTTWVMATLYGDSMVCVNTTGYGFEPYSN